MNKRRRDAGFSLIELMIVIAVLAVLSSILMLNPRVFRRKEIDKYTKDLCNQIRQMQTISMSRPGLWRLAMYEKDGRYYCIQEREEGDGSEAVWTAVSGRTELGITGAVRYQSDTGGGTDTGDTPVFVWRFNRDTGACTEGAGTYHVTGSDKTNRFKVYEQSGRCEERNEP